MILRGTAFSVSRDETARLLWACLSQVGEGGRPIVIVKPETVSERHRESAPLFWTRRVRCGQPGHWRCRRKLPDLIRTMSCVYPLWGAPEFTANRSNSVSSAKPLRRSTNHSVIPLKPAMENSGPRTNSIMRRSRVRTPSTAAGRSFSTP